MSFARQLDREPSLFSLPGTKSLRFEAIHFHWPIERQYSFVEKIPLPIFLVAEEPKFRMLGAGVMQPSAALFSPIGFVPIAARFDEFKKRGIRRQVFGGAEGR